MATRPPGRGGRSFRRSLHGVSPVLTSLYLVASAFVLAGGFYVARDYYLHEQDDFPDISTWGDEGNDRILVVQGDDVAWQDFEIKTDRPARVALEGEVSLQDGTMSPGGHYVPLAGTQRPAGGDALIVCAVGQEGAVLVSIRDAATHTTVFEQTLDVGSCPVGAVGAPGQADKGQGRRP